MRIAIVGGGIAGLTAAWRLANRHEVTVFEADGRVGGHTDTHRVVAGDGREAAVDTGFIVFNRPNYPGFCAMLDELGVESRPSDMSFSVRNDRSHLEYGTSGLAALLSDPVSLLRPRFYRMLAGLRRFNREAAKLLDAEPALTVGDWLAAGGYPAAFAEEHLLPMVGALWSAEPDAALRFPARHLARFMHQHRMLQVDGRPEWRTIAGGSQRYVEALVAATPARWRTATPVRGIRRGPAGVELRLDAGCERYDEVVIACHSDQALALLDDASAAEQQVLGAVRYQRNEVLLHTDERVMPVHKAAWSSWNARVPAEPAAACTVSYWMNRLQGLPGTTNWFVSLNLSDVVDPERVLRRREYAHPVFDEAALRAQARWSEVSGQRHTHYCGAWWGWGFHEDGVQSALRVADSLQAEAALAAA